MTPILVPNLKCRPGDSKIVYAVNLYTGVADDIEEIARLSGMRYPDVVRHALNELIDKHNNTNPQTTE